MKTTGIIMNYTTKSADSKADIKKFNMVDFIKNDIDNFMLNTIVEYQLKRKPKKTREEDASELESIVFQVIENVYVNIQDKV